MKVELYHASEKPQQETYLCICVLSMRAICYSTGTQQQVRHKKPENILYPTIRIICTTSHTRQRPPGSYS